MNALYLNKNPERSMYENFIRETAVNDECVLVFCQKNERSESTKRSCVTTARTEIPFPTGHVHANCNCSVGNFTKKFFDTTAPELVECRYLSFVGT